MFAAKRTPAIRFVALVFLVFTALCQCGGVLPRVFGASVFLLIPATVGIAMCESELGAVVFGLLAGALWDYSSVMPDGAITLFMGIAGFVCAFSVRFFLRRNLSAACVLGGILSVAAGAVFSLLSGTTGQDRQALFAWFYLPSAVYSVLFTPLYYFMFSALYKDGNAERVI